MSNSNPKAPSLVDRALRFSSDVRAGEGATVLALLANLFLILVAYYIIKTVREPLILASGGAELKSYAAAGQAGVLIVLVPLYSKLASSLDRMRLIWGVTAFFVFCLEAFYVAAQFDVPYLGVIFYIWVGIFSLAVITQFWSYANDIYTRNQGERLFPVVAVGATVGGVTGAKVAEVLFKAGMGAYELLHVAAAILVVHGFIYMWVERRSARAAAEAEAKPAESIGEGNGFALVLRSPFLRWIALLLILLNLVNTTGEYILSSMVVDAAQAAAALDPEVVVEAWIGAFYGQFFFWVNVGTVLVQALLVSRIVKYLGMRGVLFALPIVAFGAYALVAAGVGFAVVRWAKTAENMTDYSVMNTAKAMLWLPTTRAEKYQGKQAIDTFFVRLGDVLSAVVVFFGSGLLGLGVTAFAIGNLVVVVLWSGAAFMTWRHYEALNAAAGQEST